MKNTTSNSTKQNRSDRIYSMPLEHVGNFRFDERVVDVFPDMISRSVPGYASILSMIEQLAARYVQPATNVYDLGCSLGAATKMIRNQAPASSTIFAIDNSPAMLARLKENLAAEESVEAQPSVVVVEDDVNVTPLERASFVVLNFTLQFIPAADRQSLLSRICEAMLPDGALLISEKICFEHERQQDLLVELHHDFKRANGYSDLEIAQKRTALEQTLIPETLETHLKRLEAAGFNTVAPWFQCFNFASILALKS
ncbi:MAG: carboxy-S-adenosyl-L-methionine synthase CmoA [Pirellulaceae bacterium]